MIYINTNVSSYRKGSWKRGIQKKTETTETIDPVKQRGLQLQPS